MGSGFCPLYLLTHADNYRRIINHRSRPFVLYTRKIPPQYLFFQKYKFMILACRFLYHGDQLSYSCTPCSKKETPNSWRNSIIFQPILKKFSPSGVFIKDPTTTHASLHYLVKYMSENKRKSQTDAVINDNLQGTVVTCGEIVNNQNTGLLLSLRVKIVFFKPVNI